MPHTPNVLWGGYVDHLTARILEESGYKTDADLEAAKVQALLSHGSLRIMDVENLLCGLYAEAHRERKKKPRFTLSQNALDRRLERICDRYDFFRHPELLAGLTVGEFLALKGMDEVTIPGMLEELILSAEEVREPEKSHPHDN